MVLYDRLVVRLPNYVLTQFCQSFISEVLPLSQDPIICVNIKQEVVSNLRLNGTQYIL